MSISMTVREAAQRMGVGQTFVREGLERGFLPFGSGFAVGKGKRRTFQISREAFEKYMREGKSLAKNAQ